MIWFGTTLWTEEQAIESWSVFLNNSLIWWINWLCSKFVVITSYHSTVVGMIEVSRHFLNFWTYSVIVQYYTIKLVHFWTYKYQDPTFNTARRFHVKATFCKQKHGNESKTVDRTVYTRYNEQHETTNYLTNINKLRLDGARRQSSALQLFLFKFCTFLTCLILLLKIMPWNFQTKGCGKHCSTR